MKTASEQVRWTRRRQNGGQYTVPRDDRTPLLIAAMCGDLAGVYALNSDSAINLMHPALPIAALLISGLAHAN